MSVLAALVPPPERPAVEATAGRLHQVTGSDGAMGQRVCVVVAACAPRAPIARLATLVRYALWAVALDDRLDGPGLDPAALARLRQAVAAALAGPGAGSGSDPHPAGSPGGVDDPLCAEGGRLGQELAGLVAELAESAPAGVLPAFRAALLEAVDAAIAHNLLGKAVADGAAAPPTAADYLAVAARTSNYASFAYALLAVAGSGAGPDQDAGPRLDLAAVDRALGHGGAAVRLANDLRSVDRDRAESTLNVLGLRTRAGTAVTRRWVRDQIAGQIRRHDTELGHPMADLDHPAWMLRRALRLSVGLYRRTDLR